MILDLDGATSYATRENALKAIDKKTSEVERRKIRFIVAIRADGRFVPCGIGQDALEAGLFHRGICVLG